MTPGSILIASSTNGFSTRFKRWLKFALQWECDLDHQGNIKVEHLGDGAGVTFAGLTSRDDGLPESPSPIWVAETYQKKYWIAPQAEVMPMPVGEVVANYALNCGPGRAAKFLQSALNDFGGGAKIEVDGVIGPRTIQAAWKVPNSAELALGIIAKSQSYYAKIALQGREQWLNGWINRNRALRETFCA